MDSRGKDKVIKAAERAADDAFHAAIVRGLSNLEDGEDSSIGGARYTSTLMEDKVCIHILLFL